MAHTIDLALPGPTEAAWASVVAGLPHVRWQQPRRIVVVSPHPDDETLGAGGAIAEAASAGVPVVVVAVSDGEAGGDAAVRRAEQDEAVGVLSDGIGRVIRLGLPDGSLTSAIDDIASALQAVLRPGDRVLCPLATDGHPDHRAVAIAATGAGRSAGAEVQRFPVWAWHCHAPAASAIRRGRRVDLSDDAHRRKVAAVACYRSQIDGPEPVVPPFMVPRLTRRFEVFVPDWGARS